MSQADLDCASGAYGGRKFELHRLERDPHEFPGNEMLGKVLFMSMRDARIGTEP